jgi:hypothetical protein
VVDNRPPGEVLGKVGCSLGILLVTFLVPARKVTASGAHPRALTKYEQSNEKAKEQRDPNAPHAYFNNPLEQPPQ